MSKTKQNTSTPQTNVQTQGDTMPLEQNTSSTNSTSSTVEPQVSNDLLVTADGQSYDLDLTIVFKDDTKQSVKDATNNAVAQIASAYSGVTKGYFTMVSGLAVIIGNKYYQNIKGIKSPQEFLQKVIGIPKSTSSEMCKVAKRFYTSLGNLKNEELGLFTYSELIKLADKDDEIIDSVIDRIKAIGEKHKRTDVIEAIQQATEKALGVEESKSEETESKSEETESKSGETESKSDSKSDFKPTDKTPFDTDWKSEYIKTANTLTDTVDALQSELKEENVDYKELAQSAITLLTDMVKSMLDKITE